MGFSFFNSVALCAKLAVDGGLCLAAERGGDGDVEVEVEGAASGVSHRAPPPQPLPALQRVLIVDWDVHHGNGTEEMFAADPRVFYFSVHRGGPDFYPGTGAAADVGRGAGEGFNLNCCWSGGGRTDADYRRCWEELLLPVLRDFRPELVLVSGKFTLLPIRSSSL